MSAAAVAAARDMLAANERNRVSKAGEIEAAYSARRAASCAAALGESIPEAPTKSAIEELELELQGLEAAAPILQQRLAAAESRSAKAKRDMLTTQRAKVAALRADALLAYHAALEPFRTAAVRLMALDGLNNQDLRDPDRNPQFMTAEHAFGPAALLVASLREFGWPDELRPEWLPKNGGMSWRSFTLPGMEDAKAAALAAISEQENH